ncbi:MAG: hypothetical protein LT102_07860 [Burkholderiaceae bacterium]|nr:hypothetical protein [Burkholderiaceae bacterium]
MHRPDCRLSTRRCVFSVALPRAVLSAWVLSCAAPAFAWSGHALDTWAALKDMPELARLEPVRVESLDAFLVAQADALGPVLDAAEAWSREHVPAYPPRPEALRFDAAGAQLPDERRRRFIAALRIAPDVRLALFLKRLSPNDAVGLPSLARSRVSTLADDDGEDKAGASPFVALREGETVSPLDVVATASDEPDYGLDIGLWENNGTEQGRVYGFGKQPFGNPALSFGTQAPFHMGFYYESPIVYAAAGFLKRTYPEYRIHLYRTLALHALRTGHDYWGWRFAGWAMHYIQDLTQPYHARVLPGVSTLRMLWINALDIAGAPGAKARAIRLVSNRHLALENFQRTAVVAEQGAAGEGPLLRALADESRGASRPTAATAGDEAGAGSSTVFGEDDPRAVVAKRSASAADALDREVAATLPARYVDDTGFEFGVDARGVDLNEQLAKNGPAARDAMIRVVVPLMREYGVYSRAFVRAMLAGGRPGNADPTRAR